MISVLAQERFLGFALGCAITGIIVFKQREYIYKSISDNQSEFISKSQIRETVTANKTQLDFAHLWNKAVDQTFRPVIESIGSRRW